MFWNKDLGSYDELVEVELKEMRRKIIPGVDKFDILTDHERLVTSEVFGRFADRETGLVENNHLKLMFTLLGQNPSESELTFMLSDIKEQRKRSGEGVEGFFSFQQFLHLTRNYSKTKQEMMAEYEEAFQLFDIDNSGHVHSQDIRKMLERVLDRDLDKNTKKLLTSFDSDQEGRIFYKDFIAKVVDENIFSNQRF